MIGSFNGDQGRIIKNSILNFDGLMFFVINDFFTIKIRFGRALLFFFSQ